MLWSMAADTSMYLQSYSCAVDLPSATKKLRYYPVGGSTCKTLQRSYNALGDRTYQVEMKRAVEIKKVAALIERSLFVRVKKL